MADAEFAITMKDNPFSTEVATLSINTQDNTEFRYVGLNIIFYIGIFFERSDSTQIRERRVKDFIKLG